MMRYLQTVVLLLSLIAVKLTDARVENIPDKDCFSQQNVECEKGIEHTSKYINVYSIKFAANFMCDTGTDGGGWIVIQRRFNRNTSFNRNWAEYKIGFGSICDDYWLGNDHIHNITNSGTYELRIDVIHRSNYYFANYRHFSVDDESNKYTLHVDGFSGNTGDNLMYHNMMQFSTPDRDNDQSETSCAQQLGAGWWYNRCHMANLNGQFGGSNMIGMGVIWTYLTGQYGTLSAVEMKIRRVE